MRDGRFVDRRAAGRALAAALQEYTNRKDVVVLALPRGGVPVGVEVAEALGARLEPFLVRKLGVPGHEELAMGALASGGVRVLDNDIVRWYHVDQDTIDDVVRREAAELERRRAVYGGGPEPIALEGRVAILVDDGLATGSTMRAAVRAARQGRPSRVVVAVPVGAPTACAELGHLADEVVCVHAPAHFSAVGEWYDDFTQTSDEEVRELLSRHARTRAGQP